MRRVVSALLSACVLVSLAILTSPAKAGDYYDDGYYRPRHSYNYNTYYSTDCCYKKIVRHERSVHYRRLNDESYYDRPYRHSYYAPPSYRPSYYDRPYRSSYTYDSPRRYGYDSYVSRGYVSSYSNYPTYSSYADSCYQRSVPIADDRGGWVWGTKTRCY